VQVIVLAGADVDRHDEESDDDVQTIGVRPSRTVEWNFDAAEALRGAVTCSGSSEPASGMQEPALENNAVLKEASAEADATVAARALSRVLKKEHFKQMEIIGQVSMAQFALHTSFGLTFSLKSILPQFNLGFIIARLGNDLFILDQHASDEKFNFETLQKSTVMHQQPLVRPMVLEVAASEEEVILYVPWSSLAISRFLNFLPHLRL
jgi:DNA mismatch repair ATPase MutL